MLYSGVSSLDLMYRAAMGPTLVVSDHAIYGENFLIADHNSGIILFHVS